MPKISDLNPTDFPKLEHMFPVELNGESNHLTISQVREILLYSAAEVSFQTGVTVEQALNDLISGKANVNDVAAAFADVYTKSQSDSNLVAAVTALVDGATLDTLKKLSTAINNDDSFATTMATALGLRLRVDANQELTSPQKIFALNNLGVGATGKTLFEAATADAARTGIGATTIGSALITATNTDAALAAIFAPPRPSASGRGLFQPIQTVTGGNAVLPAGGSYAFLILAYDSATGQIRNGFAAGVSAGGSTIGTAIAGWIWSGVYWNLT